MRLMTKRMARWLEVEEGNSRDQSSKLRILNNDEKLVKANVEVTEENSM